MKRQQRVTHTHPLLVPSLTWRLASSRASCHISCHRMAMRISSRDTSWAWSTSAAECARTASTTADAAARRNGDCDLHATRSGYINACGWDRPTATSRVWMRPRTVSWRVWMRAMIWGRTPSHVSTATCPNPSCSASRTSSWAPWLNHRVSRRSTSWRWAPRGARASPTPTATDAKKPRTAGAAWRAAAATSWRA